MSAWLCENKTLSLCVDVIKRDDFKDYDVENYADKSKEELIEILADLNTKSLNCRYDESPYHVLKNREYVSLDVEFGQLYTSVACYLYQTCECPENVEHPLFEALLNWRNAQEINRELIYGKYHWDIDNPIGA